MKKLEIPQFDRKVVKILRSRLTDVPTARSRWESNRGIYKKFKDNVTETMLKIQSRRCAYCGTRLHEDNPHRDHIAPKNPHYYWTFWPTNLVLTCYCCNSDRKGTYNTVAARANTYRRTIFNIVHPFLDEPSDHLKFTIEENSILISPKDRSPKGYQTIKIFQLMSPDRVKERAKDCLIDEDIEHLNGITKEAYLDAMKELGQTHLTAKT